MDTYWVLFIILVVVGFCAYVWFRARAEEEEVEQFINALGGGMHSALCDVLSEPPTRIDGFGDRFDWVHTFLREAKFSTWNVYTEIPGRLHVRAARTEMRAGEYPFHQDINLLILNTPESAGYPTDENIRLTASATRGTGHVEKLVLSAHLTHEEIFSETFTTRLREQLTEACRVVQTL